jgi:dephospho-CoA kinase
MLVGITGKMGSGKSTVAGLFHDWGARVISADEIGWLVLEMPEVKRALLDEFGSEILNSRGNVDRKALGRKAFSSRERLEALNGIVHPRLLSLLKKKMQSAREDGRLVVVDAALIPEWGIEDWFDRVIVVVCPEALKVERLIRLGMDRAEAEERLRMQMPDAERAEVGDHVIENAGTLEDLSTEARKLFDSIAPSRPVYLD